MYLGLEQVYVSKKNQLVFPSKFEALTGNKLFMTAWFEKSLLILPLKNGTEILQEILKDTSALLPEARDLERFLYSYAHEVELDTKKRFVIPPRLKEYAQIGSRAVVVGVGERIEMWDETMYKNYGEIREIQIRQTAINHYNRITKNT